MAMTQDQRTLTVLYVDDEPQALKYFAKAFVADFPVLTVGGVDEARALIEQDSGQIAVVVTDQRMPMASGVDLLGWLRLARPNVVRILTTAFSDLESAIEAVNNGAIFRYVTKPWDIRDLRGILLRALDVHRLQCDRETLVREKTEVLQRLIVVDQVRSYLARLSSPLDLATRSLRSVQRSLPGSASELSEAIDGVDRGIGRIKGIVAELRSFADPMREADKEGFPIALAIERSLKQPEIAHLAARVRLEDGVGGRVLAVKSQLSSVFGHLLANAGEAMRLVADGRPAEIRIAARQSAQRMLVTVHDNGIGIPPMNLPRIFDPFFTTKESADGMGLGLTITRSILMHHGGRIQVRSEYGRWTEVGFDLPLAGAGA